MTAQPTHQTARNALAVAVTLLSLTACGADEQVGADNQALAQDAGSVELIGSGGQASAPAAGSVESTADYRAFSTADEENNIQVFRLAGPSVVNITNTRLVRSFYSLNPQEIPQGSGTGFIWNDDGYIVTNYHVVSQGNRVTVTRHDGTTYDASLVGTDPGKDLAVLKIETEGQPLTPIRLGDSDQLEVGRKVIAIGNPFGLDNTMTVGVVSALGREIDSVGNRKIRDVIQTDAAINPGNSGGPLLNSLGQLVGVNTQIVSPSGANTGIGFAIPVNTVKEIVPDLIAYGRVQTPILGISLLPRPEYYRRLWNIDGVIVRDVLPDTDPQRLGMRGLSRVLRGRVQLGDVITALDGEPIRNEDDLATALERREPGDVVTVQTRRANETLEYEITLQAPPSR